MNQAAKKAHLRKLFFSKRNSLDPVTKLAKEAQMSKNFEQVVHNLLQNKEDNFSNPNNISIGSFMPIKGELNAYQIMMNIHALNPELSMCLPAVTSIKQSRMRFRHFTRLGDLKVGTLNILDPKSSQPELFPDILIAPLCAYDSELNRLGFGSGFYDRYITALRKKKKCCVIGAAFELQFFDDGVLPNDEFDQKVDFLINEREILQV